MGKLSGKIVIYTTKDNEKRVGIIRHIDQLPEFREKKKVLIRYIDGDSYEPLIKEGKEWVSLISPDPDRLKIIGFID